MAEAQTRRPPDPAGAHLDLKRAASWLRRHAGRITIATDRPPFGFLTHWLADLAWPAMDPRWKTADIAAIAFLSYERNHGMFVLRRAAGGLPLLPLSQTPLDGPDGPVFSALLRGQATDISPLNPILEGYDDYVDPPPRVRPVRRVRCLPVRSAGQDVPSGALLFFERAKARYSYRGLGTSLGEFLRLYLDPPRAVRQRPRGARPARIRGVGTAKE